MFGQGVGKGQMSDDFGSGGGEVKKADNRPTFGLATKRSENINCRFQEEILLTTHIYFPDTLRSFSNNTMYLSFNFLQI